jgi:hypothetical protein
MDLASPLDQRDGRNGFYRSSQPTLRRVAESRAIISRGNTNKKSGPAETTPDWEHGYENSQRRTSNVQRSMNLTWMLGVER